MELEPDLPRPGVLCTIVRVVGSCPQAPGAKLWATRDAFFGTVGGGRFELEVLAHARGLLERADARAHLKEWTLCRQLGQCCGGRVEVFFEPMPRRRTVHVFGAGHVGRALAEALAGSPLRVVVIDPRREWCEGLARGVEARCAEPLSYARGRAWGPDDAACVLTHSHDLDYLLVEHLLPRAPGYLGLIGSEHKADVFRARLKSALPPERAAELDGLWEARMRCPIGLPLRSKNPKVIAIAVAAQLLGEWGLASPDLTSADYRALEKGPNAG